VTTDAPPPVELRSGRHGIIGAGRLGTALAEALAAARYPVHAVASRTPASASAIAARVDGATAYGVRDLLAHVDHVWLTLPDGEIATTAGALPWRAAQSAIHCAGRFTLDVLDAARARGANVGCMHPLQSFPEREGGGTRFAGIACGVEARPPLLASLETLCRDLGAAPFSLAGVDRARYHAAAVLTSNYVVALHAAAQRAWTLAGLPVDQARDALAPLTRGAADAVTRLPLHEALTGPIARGDAATVEGHLRALDADPALASLYRRLGAALLELDLPLSTDARTALARLFEDG